MTITIPTREGSPPLRKVPRSQNKGLSHAHSLSPSEQTSPLPLGTSYLFSSQFTFPPKEPAGPGDQHTPSQSPATLDTTDVEIGGPHCETPRHFQRHSPPASESQVREHHLAGQGLTQVPKRSQGAPFVPHTWALSLLWFSLMLNQTESQAGADLSGSQTLYPITPNGLTQSLPSCPSYDQEHSQSFRQSCRTETFLVDVNCLASSCIWGRTLRMLRKDLL